MSFKFWEYEHEVVVSAPEFKVDRLDRLAGGRNGGWGMEFEGDCMRYRFEHLIDALMFAIYCNVEVVEAPERYWSLGLDESAPNGGQA
ncbi:hypothetical protein [Bradyrhizobium sp. SYSU BS000235]|uniref:hypothetical protein n=1 Tax=Bradyrhizobium sp. SYSU BS000235 TaxID=3411332 RepID=UPI003C7928B4